MGRPICMVWRRRKWKLFALAAMFISLHIMFRIQTFRKTRQTEINTQVQSAQLLSQMEAGVNTEHRREGGVQTEQRRGDTMKIEQRGQQTNPVNATQLGKQHTVAEPPLKSEHLTFTGKIIRGKYLTIGLPSMQRAETGSEYLKHCLRSLVRHISPSERALVTILIFLSDWDHSAHAQTKLDLQNEYPQHLSSGFIVIMEVDQRAYPPMENLKRNFGDLPERVKWRSKQVVDYAFMFHVGRDMVAEYYMQIEDDVISTTGLLNKIRIGIEKYMHTQWTTLEFATLGFIGKLYKSSDLEQLCRFLLMFYSEQPVDWLYKYFFQIRSQPKNIYVLPPLFQHFGLSSSLQLKKANRLMEKSFKDADPLDLEEVQLASDAPNKMANINVNKIKYRLPNATRQSTNPPAKITTSIGVYSNHIPEYAYSSTSQGQFFWGLTPVINDTFTMVFEHPVNVTCVSITTGNVLHPNDILRTAVLEYNVQNMTDINAEFCDVEGYTELSVFQAGQLSLQNLNLVNVSCLRVRVRGAQTEWIIISSIQIR